MRKGLLAALIAIPSLAWSVQKGYQYQPLLNATTGRLDYVTVLDTNSISGGSGISVVTTSSGVQVSGGGGGGSSVYPASATASFPFGLSASTITVSTMTIGNVLLEQSFDTTDSANAYTLIFNPSVANKHIVKFLYSDGTTAFNIDAENKRIGFNTASPDQTFEFNGNLHCDGTVKTDSGLRMPTTNGSFSFQGLATMTNGSAVVSNAIIDSTWSIYLTIQSPSGTVGAVYVSSFTANSTFNIASTSASDNSTVSWFMMQH